MKYISELIDEKQDVRTEGNCIFIRDIKRTREKNRVQLLALGDVGGTVLTGLRLTGGDVINEIGIYDLDEKAMRRYEREVNQIVFPDGRDMPRVNILSEEQLFDCDMFIFCASKGVPPVGTSGDVRMVQLEANRGLLDVYARMAVERHFKGIFAVLSDPVDPLCKASVLSGLEPGQVQGYGLGVMNGRARYFAEKDEKFARYLTEGRAFGPHGDGLVIADSVVDYDESISRELTRLTINSNMDTRADGFKPYIAPALSSGALSITETLRNGWNYSSVYLGYGEEGAYFGCRNKRTGHEICIENIPLDERLFMHIKESYDNMKELP